MLSVLVICGLGLRISSKFDVLSLDLSLGVWPSRPELGMSALGTNTLGLSLGV